MKVVFGTVAYEAAWKYKVDFFNCIDKQENCEFDVLVINDDLIPQNEYEIKSSCCKKINIVNSPYRMTIAELRVFLIATAKKMGYDLLVLGDFDDAFDAKRVQNIIEKFDSQVAFFYHPLYTMDKKSVFAELPQCITDHMQILESNFLGLSNTAINLNLLNIDFVKSLTKGCTPIFDWYLYARILLQGGKGILVEDAITYYRIHDNNMAGLDAFDYERIDREIKIKLEHYNLLKSYNSIYYCIIERYEQIKEDQIPLYANSNTKGYWWSQIKLQNKENKYV